MVYTHRIATLVSEVKISKVERRYVCGGSVLHRKAVRAYNRTIRRETRLRLRCGDVD